MVGKRAIKFEVHLDHVQVRGVQHCRHRQSSHAITGVNNNGQGTLWRDGHQVEQVGRIVGQHIRDAKNTSGAVKTRNSTLCKVADSGQASVLSHGRRTRTTQLDAVVFLRIVACGKHRTRQIHGATGKVQTVGGR